MAIGEELERYLQQACRVEGLDLLPPSPTFFQEQTAAVVNKILEWESPASSLGFETTRKETVKRLLPLVDFLTQPRSIDEFQALKRALLQTIWQYDYSLRRARGELSISNEEIKMGKVVDWLYWLLPQIKILSFLELINLFDKNDPEETWQLFEEVGERQFRTAEEKIFSFKEATDLAVQCRQGREEGRVGCVLGKFRSGPATGQIQLLEAAKRTLGNASLLVVVVESQKSIESRTSEGKIEKSLVLSDDDRLYRVASLEAVDCAVLATPSDEELKDLQGFFYQLKKTLNPDVLFMGSADYYLRSFFEEEAKELGMILLWHKPEIRVSTTDLIAELFRRIQEAKP